MWTIRKLGLVVASTIVLLLGILLTLISLAALDYSLPLEPRILANQHETLHYSHDSELRLKDYLLIGTHGSAAYRIDSTISVDDRGVQIKSLAGKITPGLIKQWALNQHYDIYSQLALGARYVHLEVAVHNGEWVTIHSFLAGNLSDDLSQIKSFLDDTTDGFALVHLQRFGEISKDRTGMTYMDHVHQLDPTNHYSVAVDTGVVTRETKLSALSGKMVFLGAYTNNLGIELYPRDYTGDVTTFDTNRTIQQIQAVPPKHINNPEMLLGFQWVMTPGTYELAVDAINPFNKSGLFDFLSVTDKAKLRAYLVTHADTHLQMFHIFFVDHFDPETLRCIEDYNYSRRMADLEEASILNRQ